MHVITTIDYVFVKPFPPFFLFPSAIGKSSEGG